MKERGLSNPAGLAIPLTWSQPCHGGCFVEFVGREEDLGRVDPKTVEDLLLRRLWARQAKDFDEADRLRSVLDEMGVVVMDRTRGRDGDAEGVEWVARGPGGQHRHLVVVGPGVPKK